VERCVLARHGESERSRSGLTNGDPRVPVALTEEGREQAHALGEQLRGDPIDLCVTSEFLRTQETAELALAGRAMPRLVLADLNDIRFGDYEGLPLVDYRKWAHAHGPQDVVPGGDETRAETVARYVRAFRVILARPEHDALVVAHGLPIRYVLEALAGRNPAAKIEYVPYAEPFRLSAQQLEEAVSLLERWTADPVWPT
jgi:2,3-bisphosphoglycerate-dependent phosphoglycerate mutase